MTPNDPIEALDQQSSAQGFDKTDAEDDMPASFPIRLTDVLLYDLNITRNPERAGEAMAQGGAVSVTLLRPLVTGPRMEVGIVVGLHVPGAEDPAWTLTFTLNGIYEVDTGIEQEFLDVFAQTSVLPMLWPYARELAQSLTIRMRVLPAVLPPIPLQPMVPSGIRPTREGEQATEGGREAESE